MQELRHLFTPFKIGTMELKNRLVMAPMVSGASLESGDVSENQLAWYRARALGGVGLIITESNYVNESGRSSRSRMGLDRNSQIDSHRRLAEIVHEGGARICAQLAHNGACAGTKGCGYFPVSSSAHNFFEQGQNYVGRITRKLTVAEIRELEEDFARAAVRAAEAGFDAVDLHGGHGYLVYQFLSPRFNRREDEYGGSAENRARFLVETLQAVRRAVGPDFPVMCRVNAEELQPGGFDIGFTKYLLRELEANGLSEANITMGMYEQLDYLVKTGCREQGDLADKAAEIKRELTIPVSVVGRIRDPLVAERIIREGKADLVYMGRQLIADPELPNKAREGRLEEIRPCISCNRGCFERLLNGQDIHCTVNPAAGYEAWPAAAPTAAKRKVLVVGAGPAGMEAAKDAALAGHQVVLADRLDTCGGRMVEAGKPPCKREEIPHLCRWLESEALRAGVELRRGTAVDAAYVERENPDTLILATGGDPIRLNIPGSELENVVLAENLLRYDLPTGKRVCIIGGGLVGAETAEYLVDRGAEVTVVEMRGDVLMDAEIVPKKALLERLCDKGVKMLVNAEVKGITGDGLLIRLFDQNEKLACDTVVMAVGRRPDGTIKRKLDPEKRQVIEIGDTVQTRNIMDAISEGYHCVELIK